MFPNQLTLIYRFQYADSQIVVPYIEGGAGYFTFAELRDDNKNSVFGGAAVTVAAGGLNIQMDWIDRKASQTLDADYGVNHVWLTTEVRAIVGLNESIDFSATLFNAGLLFDF
jgi:hypothetical protein